MVKFKINTFYKRIYFLSKPKIFHIFSRNEFIQCNYKKDLFGFDRIPKYTMLIDLNNPIENIWRKFNNNTRKGIRFSSKNRNAFSTNTDIKLFINFYNDFAKIKELKKLHSEDFIKLFKSQNIVITHISDSEGPLVMHSYIIDKDNKRVRLWHTSSHYRTFDKQNQKRKIIASANQNLHFRDMIFFKDQGFNLYDFGGYAYGTKDSQLIGINKFKYQFGGIIIEESNYSSKLIKYLRKYIKSLLSFIK